MAVFVAIFASISAFRSSRFAKRALAISGQTYSDRQSNFTLYLIEGCRWTSKGDSQKKLLLFHVTITNKSDSKSSFKAELEIEYIRPDDSVARAIITHDENLQSFVSNKSLAFFQNDIRIEEKGIQSKWLIFDQPATVFKECRIEKYSIKVADTQGSQHTIDSIILKELSNV